MSKTKYVIKHKTIGYVDEEVRYSDAVEVMNFYVIDFTEDHMDVVRERLKRAGNKYDENDVFKIAMAEVEDRYYIEEVEDKSIKTEDDFDDLYTCDWDDKCERYDDSFMEFWKKHPKKVWTMIETDQEEYYLVAGLHIVNALYYLKTQEDYREENEEYYIGKAEREYPND